MDRELATVIIGAVFLLAMFGMIMGWRARSRKQADFAVLETVPADLGDIVAVGNGLYVATTLSDQPLERVSVRGLGFRSRVTVTVAREGVVVALTGQEPVFIAKHALRRAQHGTWTIDKAVEKGGLLVITWMLGDHEVDSYLRLDDDSEDFVAIVNDIVEVQQ